MVTLKLRRGRREANLSATFRTKGVGLTGGSSISFDEALNEIDREMHKRASRARTKAERGPTLKEELARAQFRAAHTTKVKMPVLRIQRIDIDKIGA